MQAPGAAHRCPARAAGAALLVILWGCLSVRFGVHIGRGRAHLVANFCVSAVLLLVYQGVCLALA